MRHSRTVAAATPRRALAADALLKPRFSITDAEMQRHEGNFTAVPAAVDSPMRSPSLAGSLCRLKEVRPMTRRAGRRTGRVASLMMVLLITFKVAPFR